MNSNQPIDEWISRYNDGDLRGEELEQFLQLLASDPAISSDTELDREISGFLQDRDLLEFLRFLEESRYRRSRGFGLNCLLLAALMLIFVMIGGIWIFQNTFRNGYPMVRKEVDSRSKAGQISCQNGARYFLRKPLGFPAIRNWDNAKGQDLLAANFRPLPFMEGMVGVVTRSDRFRLLSPACSVSRHPNDSIRFQWKKSGDGNLSFELINNQGESVINRHCIPGESFILLTNSFQEGIYYWKVVDDENLAAVGKIILRK